MLVRRIARPMLSAIFVSGGVAALKDPASHAGMAEPGLSKLTEAARPAAQKAADAASDTVDQAAKGVEDVAERAAATIDRAEDSVHDAELPVDGADAHASDAASKAKDVTGQAGDAAVATRRAVQDVASGQPLPFETETYVKVNGAVQVGAGLLLALGKLPRLSSVALAATLVPTTVAVHRFWEMEGEERQINQVQFMKNVSLMGGLILAAVDTEGRPDLIHKAKHLRKETKVAGKAAAANAAVGRKAIKANAKAAKRLAAANAADAGEVSRRKAKKLGAAAKKEALAYGKIARKEGKALAKDARSTAKEARKRAEPYAKVAAARAATFADVAADRSGDLANAAHQQATKVRAAVEARRD